MAIPVYFFINASKRKRISFLNLQFLLFRSFRHLVHRLSIHKYGSIWFNRTSKFTGSAANTNFLVRFRYGKPVFIRYHFHSLRGTMFRTRSAGCIIGINNALFLYKNNLSNLFQFFILHGEWQNGPCRTNFPAFGAFVIAVFNRIIHERLHHSGKSVFKE